MTIAHIVCTYPPYYGGMGNVVFQTASELVRLGHDVTVFTPAYYDAKEIRSAEALPAREHAPEVEKTIAAARRLAPSLSYGNAARLPQIGRELEGFDLVHLHYPFFGTANLVRRWKQRHKETPLVITYHMDTRGPGWKGLLFKYYSAYWMPKILGAAERIIGSSFDYVAASDARRLFSAEKERWVELPFGVDTGRFAPREKPDELFRRHQLDLDVPVVLFVGSMDAAHYFKGIPVLLQALFLLKKSGVPCQAVLAGDGELREKYMLQAKSFGLERMVCFAGSVDDETLPMYYNMADLCVLPSIHRGEAFGMVLLEAMASGVPVVASDLPGVRTVARDAGMVVPPEDPVALAEAVAGFFSATTDRAAMRAMARRAAEEKYAWGHIARRLEDLYASLVDKR